MYCLFVDALTFVVSAVCLLMIRTREQRIKGRQRTTTLRREIADGLRWVTKDSYLRTLVSFGTVANVALTGYQAIQVVFLVRVVGAAPAVVGVVVAASGVGGVFGAFIATWLTRRAGSACGLLICLLGLTPFGLLIPLAFGGLGVLLPIAGGAAVVDRVGLGVLASQFPDVLVEG